MVPTGSVYNVRCCRVLSSKARIRSNLSASCGLRPRYATSVVVQRELPVDTTECGCGSKRQNFSELSALQIDAIQPRCTVLLPRHLKNGLAIIEPTGVALPSHSRSAVHSFFPSFERLKNKNIEVTGDGARL